MQTTCPGLPPELNSNQERAATRSTGLSGERKAMWPALLLPPHQFLPALLLCPSLIPHSLFIILLHVIHFYKPL